VVFQFATTAPSSNYHQGSRIPQIAGSTGGFLGLVIGLGLLCIACSIAVFILLKRHKRKHQPPHADGQHPIAFIGKGKGWFNFGHKKRGPGWQQTHSFADDEGFSLEQGRGYNDVPNHAGGDMSTHPHRRMYDDPFSVQSVDELHGEAHTDRGARIDRGPTYQRVSDSTERESRQSPISPTFEGGTKFKESL